jgi:thymidylate synthase (FAD)
MQARAIAITQSLVEGINTAEELLIYEARVSNPDNQMNTATAPKLLKHLIKKKHWSPFDMINFTIEVKTSRAIAAQILRHWSIKPQEFSQRYSAAVEVEPIEIRKNGATNRQSSTDVFDPMITLTDENGTEYLIHASAAIEDHVDRSMELYEALNEAEVAKEVARFILPLATTTTMYLNGSVRSWIHYLEQRTSQHAQKEHRELAQLIESLFMHYFPETHQAILLADD